MNKKLEMVKGMIATQLNYIPAFLVVYAIYYGILQQEPVMWKYIVLAVIPLGFYFIRAYVKQIVIFFILHICWAVMPPFLSQNIAESVFCILLAIVFFAVSVYFKVAKKQTEDSVLFPAMTCIIAIIAYFVTYSRAGEKKAATIAMIAIIYIMYYITYQYIAGYVDYIKNNEVSNQNIPRKHIFKTSMSALVGFLTLFVGFAVLLAKANLFADVIYKIGNLLKRFMTWLLGFAPDAMEQGEKVEDTVDKVDVLNGINEQTEQVYKLPPEIAELIDKIVTIGAYVIFGVAILLVTYAVFRAIVEAFKIKSDVNEEEVVLVKEKVTKIKHQNNVEKEKENRFSKDRKIRKMYEDLVWKNALKNKRGYAEKSTLIHTLKLKTPKEQCRDLKSQEVIRRVYEKARYSNAPITKDDIRQMKELCALEGKNIR